MNKIKSFYNFQSEKSLHSLVGDQHLIEERIAYLMNYQLDEKLNFMDKVKNSLSKNLLGSLSNIKMIDDLVDKVEELEKHTLTKEYDYEDEIDKIEIKVDQARRNTNPSLTKTLQRQRERKIEEYSTFMELQKTRIKKGIELIEKTVGRKKRRDEYAKLKLADKDYELAEFSYDLAKKKASDPEEISKLKAGLEKARIETERIVKAYQAKANSNN